MILSDRKTGSSRHSGTPTQMIRGHAVDIVSPTSGHEEHRTVLTLMIAAKAFNPPGIAMTIFVGVVITTVLAQTASRGAPNQAIIPIQAVKISDDDGGRPAAISPPSSSGGSIMPTQSMRLGYSLPLRPDRRVGRTEEHTPEQRHRYRRP